MHTEGTLEPKMLFKKCKEKPVEELKASYKIDNLQDFWISGVRSKALIKKRDFYDFTTAHLRKIHQQNVLHAEIFFDPQTHINRKIKYTTVLNEISGAMRNTGKECGIKVVNDFLN